MKVREVEVERARERALEREMEGEGRGEREMGERQTDKQTETQMMDDVNGGLLGILILPSGPMDYLE